MNNPSQALLRLDLEDILGSLHHARRTNDLGRLALLTYWEVRRWARLARQDRIAAEAFRVLCEHPPASRAEFLSLVDGVIEDLEAVHTALEGAQSGEDGPTGTPRSAGADSTRR